MTPLEKPYDLARDLKALAKQCRHMAKAVKVAGVPGPRLAQPGFAPLIRIIAGQQVSVAAAAGIWAKLEKNCGAGSGFALKLGPASFGKANLPKAAPLAKGRYVVTALVKAANVHGPGGRIELTATQARTNKKLAEAVVAELESNGIRGGGAPRRLRGAAGARRDRARRRWTGKKRVWGRRGVSRPRSATACRRRREAACRAVSVWGAARASDRAGGGQKHARARREPCRRL